MMPYSCRSGVCRTCRGTILEGKVDYGAVHATYLPDTDKAKGYALLCQAKPLSDLTVEVREVHGVRPRIIPCRVERLEKPAPDVAVIGLRLPMNENFRFLAGQYIDFLLKDGKRRSYSLATRPDPGGVTALEIHVRHTPGGVFTDHVFGKLKVRDLLRFEGPLGSFYLREDSAKPIVMVASYSFKDNAIVEENPVFTGLANYTKVLTDSTFLVALKNTFIFISLSTVAHLILGLVFAMLLNTPLLSGVTKAIFRIVYILPWLFTIAVIAVIWRLLLDPAGVVNYILTVVGLAQHGVNWLSSPNTALWALTFINIWSGYPFFMISLLAGLQGISADLYEAARLDGASRWQEFGRITLPMLRPTLLLVSILTVAGYFQLFAEPYVMTQGGPLQSTVSVLYFMYEEGFKWWNLGSASAVAFLLFLMILAVTALQVRLTRDAQAR